MLALSLRSAGAGIDLTAANHVVFMDPPTDGAQYLQAVSRARCFGQTRHVHVVRLFAARTAEEALHDISLSNAAAQAAANAAGPGARPAVRDCYSLGELARIFRRR